MKLLCSLFSTKVIILAIIASFFIINTCGASRFSCDIENNDGTNLQPEIIAPGEAMFISDKKDLMLVSCQVKIKLDSLKLVEGMRKVKTLAIPFGLCYLSMDNNRIPRLIKCSEKIVTNKRCFLSLADKKITPVSIEYGTSKILPYDTKKKILITCGTTLKYKDYRRVKLNSYDCYAFVANKNQIDLYQCAGPPIINDKSNSAARTISQ